ncbi:MAG: helix-turn-helix transcriptional regulator [Agathobacter sp.]|nr:helix-turn-helix transcriptional regulator [Agathobacter sp.]
MALRIDETVAHNLKLIRVRHHLTQQALADRANLSKQTISNLEKGQGASSKTIERLAECLDVSPLTFYQEVSERNDLKLIRVSSPSSDSSQPLIYITEINNVFNRAINDTKEHIYYKRVVPVIKNFFKANMDNILRNLDTEINSKNYHIIYAVEETLMGNIKQSIFNNDDELDDLIEE